ncbi:MAG: TonB-dependent receptor [Polymorphobacter sp.]|uniref:TonB-dependent receptor n=1 Tax=Polymorphobacter sp. TaxID=1909290 RepID=UPI003A862B2C
MNMGLIRASALAGVAGMLMQVPAFAQEVAPGAEDTGEILVTARRGAERLIDVPASVSVLSAEAIQRTGVVRAQDFLQLTPGVTIVTGTAEAGDTQVNIRGINGARDAESSVALVVDGILKTNVAQLNQNQGTLRQIEVLKGPQGALYGRNAAAGAIVINTLKPGDRFEGGVRASYGELETAEVNGYIAGPLANGLGFVLSGNYRTTDGFWRNEFLDENVVDNQETWGVDGRVVAEMGASTLDVKARYAKLTGASINYNTSFQLPNFAGVDPAFYEDVNEHPFRYYSNIRPINEQRTWEVSAKYDLELETVKFSAWAQYADVEQLLIADGTSADFARYTFPGATSDSIAASNACFASTAELTGFPLNAPTFVGNVPTPFIFDPANGSTFGAFSPSTCDGTQLQIRNQKDFSAEVRLASNEDGPLSWSLGGYFLNIKRETGVSLGADLGQGALRTLYNAPGTINPTSQLFNDRFDTDVWAAFGSVDWEATDRLKLGVALRYDLEARDARNLVPFVTDPITGGPINPGQVNGPIPPTSASFGQLQPKITLSYEIADNAVAYANWGVGFKSGGFNNQGSAAIVDQNFNVPGIDAGVTISDLYRKERSSAFEAGLKGSLFNDRVTFDLAGYYTEIRDMQFFEFFVGSFGLLRVVSNIDKVEVYGAEANLNATIVDGWSVFGSANINESEIKANASRPGTVGNNSPYTADYTINIGTQAVVPLTDGLRGTLRADWRITGPTWFHSVQDNEQATIFSQLLPISALELPGFVGNSRFDRAQRDTFDTVNLRIGLEGDGGWTLTAFANNLFDEQFVNEVIPAIEFGGSFISPGQRRVIGVEAGFNF